MTQTSGVPPWRPDPFDPSAAAMLDALKMLEALRHMQEKAAPGTWFLLAPDGKLYAGPDPLALAARVHPLNLPPGRLDR